MGRTSQQTRQIFLTSRGQSGAGLPLSRSERLKQINGLIFFLFCFLLHFSFFGFQSLDVLSDLLRESQEPRPYHRITISPETRLQSGRLVVRAGRRRSRSRREGVGGRVETEGRGLEEAGGSERGEEVRGTRGRAERREGRTGVGSPEWGCRAGAGRRGPRSWPGRGR